MTYRGLDKLTSQFREKVELFMAEVQDKVFITETWRSQERQRQLYNQGRTTPGQIVTWTLTSNHMTGNAVDIAFLGGDLYPSEHSKWEEVAKVARKYGISWGYDLWGTDKAHFQDNGQPLDYKNKLNKYIHLLKEDELTIFNDYFEQGTLNAGEIKALITIGLKRINNGN